MNTMEAICKRKSIRNFNGESITDGELEKILKAGYASPVGRAMYETLSMSVITNKALLDKWEKAMAEATGNPDMHPFYGAPTVILISSNIPSAEMANVNYSNAATIVENMALAAVELGVGACHIWGAVRALNGNGELCEAFMVPEGMTPCCAIALGHFDGGYEEREVLNNRIDTKFVR